MHGGSRPSAGRKKGSTGKQVKGWVSLSTTISPGVRAYLDKKKSQGHVVNKIVDKAIKRSEDYVDNI